MIALSALIETIAESLDQQRLEFTNIRRVVLQFSGGSLESAAARMAIPMIYATWEGFVKEVCQLYLEYIEGTVPKAAELHPAVLGHMWTPKLQPLTGGLNFSKKKSVATMALQASNAPVVFRETEKEVNTKSNLNYAVLEDIANHLCLDTSSLAEWKAHLDALVNLRNNIAHGERPKAISYSEVNDYARETLSLMEAFEKVLANAASERAFCHEASNE